MTITKLSFYHINPTSTHDILYLYSIVINNNVKSIISILFLQINSHFGSNCKALMYGVVVVALNVKLDITSKFN